MVATKTLPAKELEILRLLASSDRPLTVVNICPAGRRTSMVIQDLRSLALDGLIKENPEQKKHFLDHIEWVVTDAGRDFLKSEGL